MCMTVGLVVASHYLGIGDMMESVGIPTWVLFTSFVVIWITYVVWSRKRVLNQWKRMGIDGPEPNFWFGNVKELQYGRLDTLDVLERWSKKYGRVFGYFVGLRPQLQVTDADIVKEVFVKQFSKFLNRPDTQRTEHNLVRLRDNPWKEIRRIMNPSFTSKKLKLLSHMMNEVEDIMVEVIDEKIAAKEDIPAYKTATGLTFQIITKTAFAMDVDCQRNENDEMYLNAKAWLTYPFSILMFLINMFPGLAGLFRFLLRFQPNYGIWDKISADILGRINYRRKHPDILKGKQDLLGLMLEAAEGKHAHEMTKELTENILHEAPESDGDQLPNGKKHSENNNNESHASTNGSAGTGNGNGTSSGTVVHKPGKFLMTDQQMVDNLILFMIAGFDSTSNTIAFAIHFLAMYPEIQERAYEEIVSQLGEDVEEITADDCKKIKYVEQIVFETLRMYPPVPIFLHREAKETVTIKGFTIPKGSIVESPPWVLHRDPEYWPNPDEFNPDRFAPENQTEEQKYAFAPWGLGPRMCIGARFALMEATTAVARVIKTFKISKSDKFKDELKVCVKNILLNPAEEIYVSMERR